jgi:hypothetical protein
MGRQLASDAVMEKGKLLGALGQQRQATPERGAAADEHETIGSVAVAAYRVAFAGNAASRILSRSLAA